MFAESREGLRYVDKLKVFADIHRDLAGGLPVLPTSVSLLLRLREALAAPDCHVDLAVRLIGAEPVLAARVVAVANSVAYNPFGREIADLPTAVSRLGFATLHSLSMAHIARQLAGVKLSPAAQAIADQLWLHSAQVAALARLIARRVTGVDAETAMFAGLVHEIGGFYLLSRAEEHPGLLDGDFAEWTEVGERQIGAPLLLALTVPVPVRDAMAVFWDGYLGMPATSLGDTLLLADELAPLPSPLRPGAAAWAGESAARIEMVIGATLLSEIVAESAAEMNALVQAISGM